MSETVLQARLRRAWTQVQLADFAQVSLSSIQRAESGKPLRVDICQRICRCLGKERPEELSLRYYGDGESEQASEQNRESSDAIIESEEEDMDASRRNALRKIGSVAGVVLASSSSPSLMEIGARLHDEEVLAICKTYAPIWWRLYFEGHHEEIRKVLPNYILRLSTLADRPSRHQQLAANLLSQMHQLAYLLSIQRQDFCTALMHTKLAFQYGVLAENFSLQTSALIREAHIYFCLDQPEPMLYMYQKAFQNIGKVPPLLQGRVYIGLAKGHAFLKQEQDALRFLGLTHDTFPEHPEAEPDYSYTHWDSFTPANFEVVAYLQFNQPKHAWQVSEKIAKGALRPTHRVELLVRQAETSFALEKMDQCCNYVEQATTSALKLGSKLRFNEAYNVYQQALQRWPRERQVKRLAELFV